MLRQIPMKTAKLPVILGGLAGYFTPGRTGTEAEVTDTLCGVSGENCVEVRRYLIDHGFLRRERGGGRDWLTPEDEAPP
ncbi:MAG: DUF2087 domain-containing protein [Anaerolineae bacterium]|jgi:hypothetical protein|nr:DUF2087 domain-containing protein [Anaerolineae bacterium]